MCPPWLWDYLGDNCIQVDVQRAVEELKRACPKLLQEAPPMNEVVVMAFKGRGGVGRDDWYLTSHRVLIRDARGVTGTQKVYKSIPYHSIKSFEVQTAGFADTDVEVRVWSDVIEAAYDLVASVDLFRINTFLSCMVLEDALPEGVGTQVPQPLGTGSIGFLENLGLSNNATQINGPEVETEFKASGLLLPDETVELALKCGRDSHIFTNKRMLVVDVKGITGRQVKYTSTRWSCLRGFSLETAGAFDRDVDMWLFTQLGRRELDLKRGYCDVFAIQKYFTDKFCGVEDVPVDRIALRAAQDTASWQRDGGIQQSLMDVFSWCGDDSRMVDPVWANDQFHQSLPILQDNERVEIAFKGSRKLHGHLVLFTTKRIVLVQHGSFNTKTNFVTIPWQAVTAFGVRSAGWFLDKDVEVMLWTDFNDVLVRRGEKPPPPDPRMSFIEFDVRKDAVDLMAVQTYLATKLLKASDEVCWLPPNLSVGSGVPPSSSAAPHPVGGFNDLLAWLGSDFETINPQHMEQHLKFVTPILLAHETILQAYKCGRDSFLFTSLRIISIVEQYWTGQVEFRSVPYYSIRAFSVQTAGTVDIDCELRLFTLTYWDPSMTRACSELRCDFRKGRVDVLAIHNLLSWMVLAGCDGEPTQGRTGAGQVSIPSQVSTWFFAEQIDAVPLNHTLHTAPDILQPDERVEVSYQSGRDLLVFTSKRVLYIDTKGWYGKRVEYLSVPLRHVVAYDVKSAGAFGFLSPPNVTVYCDVPGKPQVWQNLKEGKSDIWQLEHLLARKVLPTQPATQQQYIQQTH